MSGTYYCHECEERRLLTPISTCTACGCRYIEEIPAVIDEDDEEEFNRELDFFFIHEGQEDNDDDEELLEERCLYEQLSSIYNHPIARNFDSSNDINGQQQQSERSEQIRIDELLSSIADNRHEEEQVENEIVAYDVLFEQRPTRNNNDTRSNDDDSEGLRSIFQLPFARIGRLLDTMYSFGSDEESENGGDNVENYSRRSFLDNLADILSDYTQENSIETTVLLPANNSPSLEVILSSLKAQVLSANDPDVENECIICQDVFGTSLVILNLPCNHKFHNECISRWLCVKTSCPVCRQPAHRETKNDTEEYYEPVIDEDEEMTDIINSEEQQDNDQSSIGTDANTIDFGLLTDQDLINRRDRLQRLRQELVSRRNHWLSPSSSTLANSYQLSAPSPTFNSDDTVHNLMDRTSGNSMVNRSITAVSSSMEEVD